MLVMTKIMIGMVVLTVSVASAATKMPLITHSLITRTMNAAVCTKGGGQVMLMQGKKMCVTGIIMPSKPKK
jgi:hypothetical protein